MEALFPLEDQVSIRQFLKFTFTYKKLIFQKYNQKPITTYFDSET